MAGQETKTYYYRAPGKKHDGKLRRIDDGQCDVPAGLTKAIDVAGGFNSSFALKADGTVVMADLEGERVLQVKPPGDGEVTALCWNPQGTLLALGTFLAGLHAHSWRTCVVGIVLFVAVPVLGWIDQVSILLVIGALVIVAVAAGTWFVTERNAAEV